MAFVRQMIGLLMLGFGLMLVLGLIFHLDEGLTIGSENHSVAHWAMFLWIIGTMLTIGGVVILILIAEFDSRDGD